MNWRHYFSAFAQTIATASGRPATFVVAATTILIWGITGPFFGYSNTWQLVINTGTTIVTFLMVFLLQHTQNRDTVAVQIKLDELIRAVQGARNAVMEAENMDEQCLEELKDTYRQLAQEAVPCITAETRAGKL